MNKIKYLSLIATAALTLSFSACGSRKSIENTSNFASDGTQLDSALKKEDTESSYEDVNSEEYISISENKMISTETENTVSLSLKVDTASYSNVQRMLKNNMLPPKDAVRTEEFINYFKYEERASKTNSPFSIYSEIGRSPFSDNKHMAFLRVLTDEIEAEKLPPSNITFLIDTSGSMESHDKLPLLKSAFGLLTETLTENDMVSIVTYAGSSRVALDSVSGSEKNKILSAINDLTSGGSTGGEEGINRAYSLAAANFKKDGNNRVILATDGDFNVGISSVSELEKFISKKKDSGIYLSILGFGTGNLKDNTMETLSKHGNGNYSYIGSLETAKKVLVTEMGANLYTVANDVKAQVEFNPEYVKNYRLIGYENRVMNNEEFDNDKKDAGEIGAGCDVIVMFELELTDKNVDEKSELFKLNVRYKDPKEQESKLFFEIISGGKLSNKNSKDFNFACSAAAFGAKLRNPDSNIDIFDILNLAKNNIGTDKEGYRNDFLEMIKNFIKIESD